MGPICDQCPALQKQVQEIHQVLCSELNGKPGVLERVRMLERFKSTFKSWGRAIMIMALTNIGAVIAGVILFLIKGS